MLKLRNILPLLAELEGNLDEELARLALLRKQGKLPLQGGVKRRRQTIPRLIDFFRAMTKFSETGCWEWRGKTTHGHYGIITIRNVAIRAPRFSFLIFGGVEPSKFVCHRCDNPRCVNPDHLFEGDQMDNMGDCAAKGRTYSPRGERGVKAKLREDQVLEIRRSCLSPNQAAAVYGVHHSTIRAIRAGKCWTYLPV